MSNSFSVLLTAHAALTDGNRADYWLPGSSIRSTVEPEAAGEILVSICIIVQPLTVTNSLLAVEISK